MVILGLFGLTVMRTDAERLVLFPLQRMLLIVVRCKSVRVRRQFAKDGTLHAFIA
jgi:hypothetical protein